MTAAPSTEQLPARPRILFMGTPEFALPTLRALVQQAHQVVGVVTQPDKPRGRGRKVGISPVKRFALEQALEVLQPEKASDPHFCDMVRGLRPDLIIVVAFGQILRRPLLDIPGWGVINIHGSLLPAYRGAAPIQWAVLNEETGTGLTVMRMDAGLDTGPILFQEEAAIGEEETGGQLHDRLSLMAGDLMLRALKHMAENPIRETPQDHERATYAPKIEKEMGLVDWGGSAGRISALIRALDPKPGAFTIFRGNEIKLFASRVADHTEEKGMPGRVRTERGKGLLVEAGSGIVEVREVQLPGKKRISAADFLRGSSLEEGALLGQ